MKKDYEPSELEQLHQVLHEILTEIIRVCKLLDIPYFIQGGTAMGAYFENDIMAWDDDIDLGMTRDNYNRFLHEAPQVLGKDYFLAWFGSDPHSPFYFAKVRKNNTLFLEEICQKINMHHGIYIDIFPFDKISDNKRLERLQRKACNWINYCFVAKDIWPWRYFGKCDVDIPYKKSALDCLTTKIVSLLFPKSWLYKLLCKIQRAFNGHDTTYYNIVMMPKDQIAVDSIRHLQEMTFGPNTVTAPNDLEAYLHHHYGKNIQRIPPKEKQINHAPIALEFDTRKV